MGHKVINSVTVRLWGFKTRADCVQDLQKIHVIHTRRVLTGKVPDRQLAKTVCILGMAQLTQSW